MKSLPKELSDAAQSMFVRAQAFLEREQLADPAIRAVICNAETLLHDANTMLQHGSPKTAAGLAVLSFEESGKATLIRWGKFGLIQASLTREIASHQAKQYVFLNYEFGLRFMQSAYASELNKDKIENATEKEKHRIAATIVLGALAGGDLIREGLANLANVYDVTKEDAFYVDVNQTFELQSRRTIELSAETQSHVMNRATKALDMARAPNSLHVIPAMFFELGRMSGHTRRIWKSADEARQAFENAKLKIEGLRERLGV